MIVRNVAPVVPFTDLAERRVSPARPRTLDYQAKLRMRLITGAPSRSGVSLTLFMIALGAFVLSVFDYCGCLPVIRLATSLAFAGGGLYMGVTGVIWRGKTDIVGAGVVLLLNALLLLLHLLVLLRVVPFQGAIRG